MYVYLGLGTNQGDRIANLNQVLAWLTTIVDIQRESNVYESAPLHVTNQPTFLNMAILGETTLSPHELLGAVKTIEAEMGRDLSSTAQRYGPRPIDIDILLATKVVDPISADDYIVIDSPDLTIPHPRLAERAFALRPLLDILTDQKMVHPLLLTPLKSLESQVRDQGIVYLGSLQEAEYQIQSQAGLRRVFVTTPVFPTMMSNEILDQQVYRTIMMADYSSFDGHLHLGAIRARYGGKWLFQLLDAIIQELQHPSIKLELQHHTREVLLERFEYEREHHRQYEDADFVWHGKKQDDATFDK